MTTAHEQATHQAILKLLGDKLSAAKATAASKILGGWFPGDRLTAVLPGGIPIGTVTLTKGSTTAKVTDADAYTAWVAQNHPDEVETITVVRGEYTARLLSAAKQARRAHRRRHRRDRPRRHRRRRRPVPDGQTRGHRPGQTALAWRDGTLRGFLDGLLAIEEGDDDATPS